MYSALSELYSIEVASIVFFVIVLDGLYSGKPNIDAGASPNLAKFSSPRTLLPKLPYLKKKNE